MILSTWSTLESVKEIVLNEKISGITDIAGIIACITAGCAVLKVVMNYWDSQTLNAWEIGKPVILMMLVCNFNTFVLSPIDSVIGIISRETTEVMNVSPNQYVTKWSGCMQEMSALNLAENYKDYRKELEEVAGRDSAAGKFFAKLWYGIKKHLLDHFSIRTMTLAGLIGGILFTLAKVLMFAQQILCCLYLTVNALFGPYILAISILPGFEGGLRGWLARYLQIAMWIPIGHIFMGLSLKYVEGFCDMAQQGEMGLGVEWTMIILQAATLGCVAAVPKVAGWFIESSGANDAHGAFSSPFRMMVRKVAKM